MEQIASGIFKFFVEQLLAASATTKRQLNDELANVWLKL